MTRNLALLATVAAVATVPQIAQASCSGTACSAYMLNPTWSPSDRRVNATLTNKDQTREVHLKLCITIGGVCNGIEVTLPPHSAVMKGITVPGAPGSAPPNYTVDVTAANFPPGQAASPAPAAAVNGLDTPFGKLTYFTSPQTVDINSMSKGIANFARGKELYLKLGPRYLALIDASRKMSSIDIEAEIRKSMAANPRAQRRADLAKDLARHADDLGLVLGVVADLAKNAADNLSIDQKELEASRYRDVADSLMKEAEKERAQVAAVVSIINAAISVNGVIKNYNEGKDLGAGTAAWTNLSDKLADLFTNADQLIARAQSMQEKAKLLSSDAVTKRVAVAEKHFTDLRGRLIEIKAKIDGYKADYDKVVALAQQDIDAGNAKAKGSLNLGNLTALITEAKALKDMSAESRQSMNAAREYAKSVSSGPKTWMANASDDERILKELFDASNQAADRLDQMIKEIDGMHAKLQETYAKAMQASSAP